MTVTNATGRIRRTKIQREAEGYLELDMPKQALEALSRLGAPANFDATGALFVGRGPAALERPFERWCPWSAPRNWAGGRPRPHRVGMVL